ncbi:hypothetical protein QZQ97_06565 [Serratia sp. root2]|uniref:hypothetical protein n=1 Tax=Serratia sp. root2 TaxID=3059676 RepID=UPI00288CC511|nr:hypothetical protein [Serratia sp. root2]MDT3250597.1 hypothetical protein [Serratia sp. root2]
MKNKQPIACGFKKTVAPMPGIDARHLRQMILTPMLFNRINTHLNHSDKNGFKWR